MLINVMLVIVPLNIVVLVLGFWVFSKIYSKRFDELVQILNEAVNRQRTELGVFKGMFLKEVMTHDRIFDEIVNLDAMDMTDDDDEKAPTERA